MAIFSWIGSVFGYLLNFFFQFSQNYAVAIVLFVIAIKLITFPLSIKQQKSMAKNARMAGKQKSFRKNVATTSRNIRKSFRSSIKRKASARWEAAFP